MDMNLILASIGVFLVVVLLLVVILLVAKNFLVPSGNVKLTINGEKELEVASGSTLLNTLSVNGIFLSSACGGKGSCGQCKCQVVEGGGEILPSEIPHFSRKQVQDHWRLGCQVKVKGDMGIKIDESVLGVKEWECEVISNKNVATFIKEFIVALPKGEHMDFIPGSYAQIKIPKFSMDYDKDIDKSLIGEEYLPAWEKFGLLGLKCRIYMGAKDVERQSPNVFRMRLMGAEVIPVHSGSATLKDACNEALRDWSGSYETAHYMLGTAAGPHPYPTIVREFQRMIGEETKAQILEREGRLPDAVIACVGGGSNAIGMFADFINETNVGLIGVEPGGHGIETGEHGAPLKHGRVGIYFGMKAPMMQTEDGQIEESYSISAGLDFPSVGPQHAYLNSTGRADYVSITDDEALEAFKTLCLHEGIIPALESSHALAHALKMMRENPDKEQLLVVNLSGRGDKDIFTVHDILKARGEI